ncbi:MAG: pyridoxal-phosphate dependent enzyme, partial [Pseudomonadota bacterium]
MFNNCVNNGKVPQENKDSSDEGNENGSLLLEDPCDNPPAEDYPYLPGVIDNICDSNILPEAWTTEFPSELEQQRRIATDSSRPLDQRLEAYQDIFDSEVGDTTLSRARNTEREFGIRQLYFKFEGGNPSGTQKDRIAYAQAMDALRRGYDSIVVATCGNYGAAIAKAASAA